MNVWPCGVCVLEGKADSGLENNYLVLEIEKCSGKITRQGSDAPCVRKWFGLLIGLVGC